VKNGLPAQSHSSWSRRASDPRAASAVNLERVHKRRNDKAARPKPHLSLPPEIAKAPQDEGFGRAPVHNRWDTVATGSSHKVATVDRVKHLRVLKRKFQRKISA
jgi:hypothetical protein